MAGVPAESEVTDGSQRRKEDGQGRKVRGVQEKRGEHRDLGDQNEGRLEEEVSSHSSVMFSKLNKTEMDQ